MAYLPDHPSIVVRDQELFIVNDDESETSWGKESIDEIHRIAENLDKELKSFSGCVTRYSAVSVR